MKLAPASFSIETNLGTSLGQVECPTGYNWTRELSQVSACSVTAPRQEITTDIVPWLTWISCWHGGELQWRGPVQDLKYDNNTMVISAKDLGVYMWKTRTVATKSWNSLDIASIAADMWRDMLSLQNINADPVVLPALSTSGRYSVSITADVRMIQQDMADLAKLGLRWAVVRGRPILGNQPTGIAAELAECDLTAGPQIDRSGSLTSNDVRVQGTNFSHTERINLNGLHLQTIVSIDDVFGVTNITQAAADQVQKRAYIKDSLIIPTSAALSPSAPVELNMLVPGIYIAVSALGLRAVLQLTKMQMSGSAQSMDVTLSLSSVPDLTALEKVGTISGST
jgi:hypothetical protein